MMIQAEIVALLLTANYALTDEHLAELIVISFDDPENRQDVGGPSDDPGQSQTGINT